MGQAYSYKDIQTPAPVQILPNPQRASHFVCSRNGVSSKNYNVYKNSVEGQLWLFVRKTGHTLQNKEPTTMVLETFRKEVLFVARLERRSDGFFNPTYSFKSPVKRNLEGPIQTGETKHETIRTIAHEELQWQCQTRACVFRSHAMTEFVAAVYVEALGSATRETQKIKGRDSENFPSVRTVFKERKQVNMLKYVIHLAGGQDIVFCVEEPNATVPSWNCPLFYASARRSDDWRCRWDIKVKEGFDPSLSLLIGLVCSSVLCPEKIMRHLPIKWQ